MAADRQTALLVQGPLCSLTGESRQRSDTEIPKILQRLFSRNTATVPGISALLGLCPSLICDAPHHLVPWCHPHHHSRHWCHSERPRAHTGDTLGAHPRTGLRDTTGHALRYHHYQSGDILLFLEAQTADSLLDTQGSSKTKLCLFSPGPSPTGEPDVPLRYGSTTARTEAGQSSCPPGKVTTGDTHPG